MPHLTITPLYAAAIAVLAIALTARVILLRRGRKISLGTGDDEDLARAVRAHANLVELAPLALLLLALYELGGGSRVLLHTAGLALLVGRCVHAWALPNRSGPARVAGMALTFTSLGLLALANVAAALAS